MVIVSVHWRIKREKVPDFFDYWKTKANLEKDHRSGLVGEFLCKPIRLDELAERIPAEELRFRVCDLSPSSCEAPYVSFVNVGLWNDWETFYAEVGKKINDDQPMMDFEQYRRVRTILEPRSWRIGGYPMPNEDYFS